MALNLTPPFSFSLRYETACTMLDVLLQQRAHAKLYNENGKGLLFEQVSKLDPFINALEEYVARGK